MNRLANYKREIFSAFIGAALAGIVSMSVGMYSLTKSFQYTQNKERLASLRKDIEFLARVRSELDSNTQALLNSDYRISAVFGEPLDLINVMSADEKKKSTVAQRAALGSLIGKHVPLQQLHAPREKLVVESWGTQYPEGGDISFELLVEINDYYRRVKRINLTIERMENLGAGTPILESFHKLLVRDIGYHNSLVDELKKLDAVRLKNKITGEMQRLSEQRRKISDSL